MRHLTLLVCTVFVVASNGLWAQQNKSLAIGESIPMQNELMMDVSDEKMSLKEVTTEQGLLVIFSCNTCPFVVMWEDRYAQLEEKCAETGLGMVYINSNQAKRDGDDSVEAMKAHAKKMDYSYPYLIDENSALANAFGAKTTPHIYLFNKDNELVYKGAIDDNYKNIEAVKEPYLLNAIDELLAGKKISLAETKAVGCSIKRVKK